LANSTSVCHFLVVIHLEVVVDDVSEKPGKVPHTGTSQKNACEDLLAYASAMLHGMLRPNDFQVHCLYSTSSTAPWGRGSCSASPTARGSTWNKQIDITVKKTKTYKKMKQSDVQTSPSTKKSICLGHVGPQRLSQLAKQESAVERNKRIFEINIPSGTLGGL